MNMEHVMKTAVVGLFGSFVGSFLNVVIYRLPRRESIAFPSSHCPECSTPIRYRDNIPVLSYILLRGRCRACSSVISWRYPLVELITASAAMALFVINRSPLYFVADFALASVLLAAIVIDLQYMIIPDRLNLAGGIIAVIMSFRWGPAGIVKGIEGAVIGVSFLIVMIVMGKILFRRDGVGMGDVKLAVVIGMFLGPFWCFLTFVVAVFIGGIWGIFRLVSGGLKMGHEIPFAPFIAMGGFSVLFFRKEILFLVDRYVNLF